MTLSKRRPPSFPGSNLFTFCLLQLILPLNPLLLAVIADRDASTPLCPCIVSKRYLAQLVVYCYKQYGTPSQWHNSVTPSDKGIYHIPGCILAILLAVRKSNKMSPSLLQSSLISLISYWHYAKKLSSNLNLLFASIFWHCAKSKFNLRPTFWNIITGC